MPIEKIDLDLCSGCGICEMSCPMDVIRMDEASGKASIRYVEDCTSCGFCEADCPEKAVRLSAGRLASPLTAW